MDPAERGTGAVMLGSGEPAGHDASLDPLPHRDREALTGTDRLASAGRHDGASVRLGSGMCPTLNPTPKDSGPAQPKAFSIC
ncbi:MAG: hypothetical protein ACRDQ4_23135 [Pseudonocardiaceae bacterium]